MRAQPRRDRAPLHREPASGAAFFAELDTVAGRGAILDAEVERLRDAVTHADESAARGLVDRMALALQATVLLRAGSPIAEAFCASRLGGEHGLAFGTLRIDDATTATLIERALP